MDRESLLEKSNQQENKKTIKMKTNYETLVFYLCTFLPFPLDELFVLKVFSRIFFRSLDYTKLPNCLASRVILDIRNRNRVHPLGNRVHPLAREENTRSTSRAPSLILAHEENTQSTSRAPARSCSLMRKTRDQHRAHRAGLAYPTRARD